MFKVEMISGRSPGLLVYGLDRDGELAPAQYVKSEAALDPNFREYSCPNHIWERALKVGRQHGWKPMGTVPSGSSMSAWLKTGKFDWSYEPEEWQYSKTVLGPDAKAWASALLRVPAPLLENDDARITPGFIDFLAKGSFDFAWDD